MLGQRKIKAVRDNIKSRLCTKYTEQITMYSIYNAINVSCILIVTDSTYEALLVYLKFCLHTLENDLLT